MIFNNFELNAFPKIMAATCKHCRGDLKEVPNGFLSKVWFCPECEFVYKLELMKVPLNKLASGAISDIKNHIKTIAKPKWGGLDNVQRGSKRLYEMVSDYTI